MCINFLIQPKFGILKKQNKQGKLRDIEGMKLGVRNSKKSSRGQSDMGMKVHQRKWPSHYYIQFLCVGGEEKSPKKP